MILLDTHVVFWLLFTPEKLSATAHERIRKTRSLPAPISISTVSIFELAYAMRRGRLPVKADPETVLGPVRSMFEILPISEEIATCAGLLKEPFHGDPMDRLIAATAIVHKATLVTADGRIQRSALCKTIW